MGKTRLAVAAAEQLAERFPDGIWFVDLAPLIDPGLVLPTIARVVGVREQAGQHLLEALPEFLGKRRALLVLDNMEHLLSAAAALDGLLTACPRLAMLVTSREPLHLRREQVVVVPQLPVPDASTSTWEVADLGSVPAVKLFVARAQAVDPHFSLSSGNAEAVAALSRRLEGLPLAVELAAARVRLLTPAQLLGQMDQGLALLRWDAQDLPPRHRSLHATLDWSYVLLTPDQQALFRRLSVFASGFTLEGAEAVFSGDVPGQDDGAGDGLFYRHAESPAPLPTVLEDLAALIDHSLVQRVDSVANEPRYRMLETVRQFGLERLQTSGEEGEVRQRHLIYFVALAERLSEHLWLPQAEQVLAKLDAKHADVRTALTWAETSGEAELGLRLTRAMVNYWVVRNHLREGQDRLERALTWDTPGVTPERARVLVGLGWLAHVQGDSDRLVELNRQGQQVAAAAGGLMTEATAWDGLAMARLFQGRYVEAAAQLDEALTRFQELEPALVAGPQYVTHGHSRRGQVALAAGDLAAAHLHLTEAEWRQRALGFTWGLILTLRCLGDLARIRGDLDRSLPSYRESLELAHLLGDPNLMAGALEGLAGVASAQDQLVRAVRLHAAAAVLREQLGTAAWPWEQLIHERDLAAAQATLSEVAFTLAWTEGAALPLEVAVSEALEEPGLEALSESSNPIPPARSKSSAGPQPVELSPREREVLVLVARGYTNKQIGEALFISPRTVNFHVSNLLAKLELDSRAAAAAFAARHGLA